MNKMSLSQKGLFIAILVVLMLLTVVVSERVMDMRRLNIRNSSTPMSTDEQIIELLDAGDFRRLYHYCETNGIYYWNEEYEAYYMVLEAVDNYNYVVEGLMEIVYATKETPAYTYTLESLGKRITDFYELEDADHYEYYDVNWELNLPYYEEMKTEMNALLKTYLHLDDEGLKEFLASSDIQKSYRIEELYHEYIGE